MLWLKRASAQHELPAQIRPLCERAFGIPAAITGARRTNDFRRIINACHMTGRIARNGAS